MATTAAEVIAEAQALGYGTDVESAQLVMLNGVHKRVVNARRWTFLVATDSEKSLTVGDPTLTYDALDDTRRLDAVRLEVGTEYIDLDYLEPQDFRSLEHGLRENGTPEYWTRRGDQIHVWPRPDQAYSVEIDYVANPVKIDAGSDEVQVPDSHVDVLVWALIAKIAFRERDWEAHNFARQMYAELYTEMLGQYGMTDRKSATRVKSSGFFDAYEVLDPWIST